MNQMILVFPSHDNEEDRKAWLEYRKQGITLIKSLFEADNKLEMLAALSEKDYWSVLNEQKLFEKALKQKEQNDLSGGEPTTPVKQTDAHWSKQITRAMLVHEWEAKNK